MCEVINQRTQNIKDIINEKLIKKTQKLTFANYFCVAQ